MAASNKTNLIWLDLEMTGLDINKDFVLEIATVVTDPDLNIIEEGPVFAIYQPEAHLNLMNSWNVEHHTQSGLVARVQQSKINEAMAEESTLHFLKKHVLENHSPLCGNTVHQDRKFLLKYMPKLEQFFHYRNLDVSTLKILSQLWFPDRTAFAKRNLHIALADIQDSIEELKFYRKHLMR